MHNIKHTLLALTLLVSVCLNAQQPATHKEGELDWYVEVIKANEVSRAQHKPIFAFFTGSDWCGWCKKLQHDVFAKPAFVSWAKKNVVLLELDFPRSKTLAPEMVQQNNSLQQAFKVQGFPTIWMFYMNKSADSATFTLQALGSCGYPGGAEQGREEVKFLADANAILANDTAGRKPAVVNTKPVTAKGKKKK
ncbi:MAG: thioredoxin family protein [Flavipsychrobacter sp.]|nr:thioredoxin family protein [Flavipsychrobacter sp.]